MKFLMQNLILLIFIQFTMQTKLKNAKGKNEYGRVLYNGGYNADGLYNGEGSLYYPNGNLKYHGNFKAGIYEGYGELYCQDGTLESKGIFQDGKLFDGEGVFYVKNPFDLIDYKDYHGQMVKGKYEGIGKKFDQQWGDDYLAYEGGFKDGYFYGEGRLFYPDGKVKFEGIFTRGKIANGVEYLKD